MAARPDSKSTTTRADADAGAGPSWLPWAAAGVVGGGVLLAVIAWMAGDLVAALAAAILTLSIVQGLWRGLSSTAGLLLATLAAFLLARPFGRAFEPVATSLFGTGGLMSRLVATLIAGGLIIVVGSALITWPIRRTLRSRPEWRAWDRAAGGAIGAAEGLLLVLVLLWAPKALEPFARARLADRAAEADSGAAVSEATQAADRQADRIRRMADAIDRSVLSGAVTATNPIADSSWMKLAEEFSIISRHPEARDHFLNSQALRRLQDLPSVKQAIERTKDDPELAGLYSESGISKDAIWKFLNSPRVLEILDGTSIVADIEPLVPDLKRAIEEARARVPRPR